MSEPFHCPHADPGQDRCPEWRCDCFIKTHPNDPFGLHPEDFIVGRIARNGGSDDDA